MRKNGNRSLSWLNKQNRISVDNKIKDVDNPIRGIYGIFVKDKNEEEKCVYVGKAFSLYDRMFGSTGHIPKLKKNIHTNKQLQDAVNVGKEIEIKILEEVPFEFDNYYRDMQRLASKENKYIDQYQKINQCLEQVPEGTKTNEEEWERLKEKSK